MRLHLRPWAGGDFLRQTRLRPVNPERREPYAMNRETIGVCLWRWVRNRVAYEAFFLTHLHHFLYL